MATVYQQNSWAQKPIAPISINRGSSQANGLVGFWPVLQSDNNRLRNLVGSRSSDAVSDNGWKKGGGLYGPSAQINGSTQRFIATGSWPSNNITFSCRVKFNAVGTGTTANSEIFQRDDDNFYWGFQLTLQGPKLQFYNVVNGSPNNIVGATTLVINKWYHVAVTFNTTGYAGKIYLNGVVDASGAMGTTGSVRSPPGGPAQWTFGSTYVPNSRYVNGYMEDIRVYNRTLSQAEISEIYRNPMNIYTNQSNIMYSSDSEVAAGYNASQFFMVM